MTLPDLPGPARYFPITRGRYETAANMALLGRDFGFGARDALAIQLDSEFPAYRGGKLAARAESLPKYVAVDGSDIEIQTAVTRLLIERLTSEHPYQFHHDPAAGTLYCRLTGERLHFARDLTLTRVETPEPAQPPYLSAFDALCCQIQEDLAIVHLDESGDRVCAVHVCAPSGWRPSEKVGQSFPEVHAPVAGIEPVSRTSPQLLKGAVDKGPFVRFGWGIAGDARLNRHPDPPPGIAANDWQVPAYNPLEPASPFVMRVERQVLWGLPDVRAFLFFIRVYTIPASEVRANDVWRGQLLSALRTMPEESARYKGLAAQRETLIAYLA